MRLFIAEKPSLGRAIAEAIGKPVKSDKLSMTMDNGDVICWSAGHILEPQMPEAINSAYKQWTLANLPIIPSDWVMVPREDTKDLLGNIGRLLKQADIVVNAGDADREGQLLIDEILQYFKYKGEVLRILVTDMNSDAIRKALSEMKPNEEYKNLSLSAAARQRADWLLGINMTRLFTVTTPREKGEVLSVGRVQTPTLALVVERDRLIENFQPTPYYVVKARSIITNGEFIATWKPSEDHPGLDSEGRIVDAKIIDELERKLNGKVGHVTKFKKGTSLTQPPLTYSLPTLQIDASKAHGFSPDKTLKVLQTIYEAKYVTYPRSDCGYLPETLYDNRNKVIAAISAFSGEYKQYLYDMTIKTDSWNTSKTAEHHGIIPTGTIAMKLNDDQKKIYDLIARRYAAQFLPPQEFANVEIEYTIENEIFFAKSRQCTKQGWHSLYAKVSVDDEADENKDKGDSAIPDAVKGENVGIRELIQENKKTTPPKRFTEASLLAAMNNIHKYVEDPKIKKILKDTLGIGTAATQAKIIDTLINGRSYIAKDKKVLISTPKGRALVDAVDEILRKPDTTAVWEQALGEIQEGRLSIDAFLNNVISTVKKITETRANASPEVRAIQPQNNQEGQVSCPVCKDGRMRLLTGKFGKFWICNSCALTLNDDKGKPQKVSKCPICGSLAVRINGKKGYFWLCRNKDCKKIFSDSRGKLVVATKQSDKN